jgi:hypothetical protein
MAIGDTGYITGSVSHVTDRFEVRHGIDGTRHAHVVRLGISTDPGRSYTGLVHRLEALRRLQTGDSVTLKYEVVEFGEREILACTRHTQA